MDGELALRLHLEALLASPDDRVDILSESCDVAVALWRAGAVDRATAEAFLAEVRLAALVRSPSMRISTYPRPSVDDPPAPPIPDAVGSTPMPAPYPGWTISRVLATSTSLEVRFEGPVSREELRRGFDIRFDVTDDVGTSLHMTQGGGGGNDVRYRSNVVYEPGPAPGARHLLVSGPTGTVQVPLVRVPPPSAIGPPRPPAADEIVVLTADAITHPGADHRRDVRLHAVAAALAAVTGRPASVPPPPPVRTADWMVGPKTQEHAPTSMPIAAAGVVAGVGLAVLGPWRTGDAVNLTIRSDRDPRLVSWHDAPHLDRMTVAIVGDGWRTPLTVSSGGGGAHQWRADLWGVLPSSFDGRHAVLVIAAGDSVHEVDVELVDAAGTDG